MLLKIYGNGRTQVVNLQASFFTNQQEMRHGKPLNLGPKEKAYQMAKQLFGKSYVGHVLEMDGKIIYDNLKEDRDGNFKSAGSVKTVDFTKTMKSA